MLVSSCEFLSFNIMDVKYVSLLILYGLQNFENFHKGSKEAFRKCLLKTSFQIKQVSSLCDNFNAGM